MRILVAALVVFAAGFTAGTATGADFRSIGDNAVLMYDAPSLRASKVSTAKRFRFDLGAGVQRDFFHATEKNAAGRVLRDADLSKP